MSAAKALQHDPVISVDVARGLEGVTFSLYPLSKDYLRALVPGLRLWPRVFIARETVSDFRQLEVSLQLQVIQLLTGLSLDRLRQLGVPVEFVDVRSDAQEVLARLDPRQAPASPPSD